MMFSLQPTPGKQGRTAARRGYPRPSSLWVRLLVSATLLTLLLSQIEVGRVFAILANARPELLALTFALLIGDRFLSAYRWYVLLRGLDRGITYGAVLRLAFVSGFVGCFMPGASDVVRVYGVARARSNAALAFSSVLVERVQAVIALIALMVVGVVAWPPGLPPAIAHLAWLALLALAAGYVVLMHPRLRQGAVRLLPGAWLAPVREQVVKVYACLDAYRGRPALLGWAMTVTLGFQFFRVFTVFVAASALGLQLSILYLMVLLPVVFFVTLLPIAFAGGLGVQEVGFVYLLGFLGVSAEAAFTLSLLLSLTAILLVLPGAWFYARAGVVHR